MKKLAALLLLLGALLALAACGYPVKSENSGTPDAAVTTVKPDSGYTLGGADVVQLNGFRSIDIEWISGSVSVELYDGEGIEIKETLADDGAVSVPMEWRVNEDDSTLDIRSQPQLLSVSEEKHLMLKLPRSMVLYGLNIDAVSAGVSVDLTDEDLSTTSGAISGSVRTQELETDSVSGNVDLTLDILPTELDIETSSGPVTLAIPTGKTTSVLSVELRTTSGQFSSDVPVTHTKDAPWEFQTVSGDVTITTVK